MKYGLEFAGVKKRVRRDWGATVLTVVTLLAVAALCGWLWSCVRHVAMPPLRTGVSALPLMPLAMAPVTQGMVYGLLLSLSVLVIVMAGRKVRANEQEAELRWSEQKARIVSLGLEDLREIVSACRAESREALLLVECAQRTVEQTQIDTSLTLAQRKLSQVTRTLGELHKSLTVGAAPQMRCPHCQSGLLWSEDRGAHCDGCDDFNPEVDLTEGETAQS